MEVSSSMAVKKQEGHMKYCCSCLTRQRITLKKGKGKAMVCDVE